jgi:parallel beta-helix repeat protein
VISGRTWVTIHGFTVSNTSDHAIDVTNASSHITIDGNRVTQAGSPTSGSTRYGIHTSGVTQSTISNNIADHNSDAGIRLSSNSNDNTISGNDTFANARGYVRAAAGIDVRDSTGNLVFRNLSHDNEDSGINAWTGTANGQNTFFDNVTYGNGDHGIDVHNAVDAHVVANTVFRNADSGIESTTSTRTYLANNVSVDNGINSPRTSGEIRIDAGSVGTAILNDDLVYLRTPGVMIDWNGTQYSSLAAFRNATGQESRGLQADPKFRNAAAADFHLLAGSPAIDSANSGAAAEPGTDFDGNARVDDPATPNTGIGPIAYGDRGAFEFQP